MNSRCMAAAYSACIAPWNFPLAIFTGQVAGALAAGNAVLAKPAEQTPLIAAAAVRLLHQAGVPGEVLHLLPGDGSTIGRSCFRDPRLAGVAFTGSTETAVVDQSRACRARRRDCRPLIAETGGMNAMIVDSTALPEQVARDVLASAFDSAGQRCSCLRVLFVQDDVADKMLDHDPGRDGRTQASAIRSSSHRYRSGDRRGSARRSCRRMPTRMTKEAKLLRKLLARVRLSTTACSSRRMLSRSTPSRSSSAKCSGRCCISCAIDGGKLDKVCEAINATGYGLTLGVHSRIEETADFVRERMHASATSTSIATRSARWWARSRSAAKGLSGTGPKAGGPHYLAAFRGRTHLHCEHGGRWRQCGAADARRSLTRVALEHLRMRFVTEARFEPGSR